MPSIVKVRQMKDHFIILERQTKTEKELPTSFRDPLCFRNNAGCTSLRVAYLLGCDPIYLVGIDCQLDGLKTHWHENYPQERRPSVERLFAFYDLYVALLDKMIEHRKIYCCSPTSELNRILEWTDLKKVLNNA